MVDWKLRLKRMALVWARLWRIYAGEPYSLILWIFWGVFFVLQIFLTWSFLQFANLSVETANALFFLLLVPYFLICFYLTSKVMDYLDMRGW